MKDRAVPFTSTYSRALLDAAREQARERFGGAVNRYIDNLIRADLAERGVEPPPALAPAKQRAHATRRAKTNKERASS